MLYFRVMQTMAVGTIPPFGRVKPQCRCRPAPSGPIRPTRSAGALGGETLAPALLRTAPVRLAVP